MSCVTAEAVSMLPVLMATCFRWSLVLIADETAFPGKCPLLCIVPHSLACLLAMLATHGPAQLWKWHCNQRDKAAQERHRLVPADDSVMCFQAIDFYIANKVFLFDLLSTVL